MLPAHELQYLKGVINAMSFNPRPEESSITGYPSENEFADLKKYMHTSKADLIRLMELVSLQPLKTNLSNSTVYGEDREKLFKIPDVPQHSELYNHSESKSYSLTTSHHY